MWPDLHQVHDNPWTFQFHQQSKHIIIYHYWVQDLVTDKVLKIQNCCDPEQTADILSMALPKPKFTQHSGEMGVQPAR